MPTVQSITELRRETVLASAITVFASAGYLGTPISAVADHAGSDVQRFITFGELCHVITTLGLGGIDNTWAHLLNEGVRHPSTERG